MDFHFIYFTLSNSTGYEGKRNSLRALGRGHFGNSRGAEEGRELAKILFRIIAAAGRKQNATFV